MHAFLATLCAAACPGGGALEGDAAAWAEAVGALPPVDVNLLPTGPPQSVQGGITSPPGVLNVVRPGSKLQPAPPRPAVVPPPGRPAGKGIGIREPSPVRGPAFALERARVPANDVSIIQAKSTPMTPPDMHHDDADADEVCDSSVTAEEKRLRRMGRVQPARLYGKGFTPYDYCY